MIEVMLNARLIEDLRDGKIDRRVMHLVMWVLYMYRAGKEPLSLTVQIIAPTLNIKRNDVPHVVDQAVQHSYLVETGYRTYSLAPHWKEFELKSFTDYSSKGKGLQLPSTAEPSVLSKSGKRLYPGMDVDPSDLPDGIEVEGPPGLPSSEEFLAERVRVKAFFNTEGGDDDADDQA